MKLFKRPKSARLAALEDDTCVGYTSRPHHWRLRRAIEISRLGCKCQLCLADTATNALQSGGVEDDRPCSTNQNDEGAWAASSAR